MKTKKIIKQIVGIPGAVLTNEFTLFQVVLLTAVVFAGILGGLILINPTLLKN